MGTHRAADGRGHAGVPTGGLWASAPVVLRDAVDDEAPEPVGHLGPPGEPGLRPPILIDRQSMNYTRDVDRFFGWFLAIMLTAALAPVLIAAIRAGMIH